MMIQGPDLLGIYRSPGRHATLHEQKRKDPVAAAEAWGRIANCAPEDDVAINTAVNEKK